MIPLELKHRFENKITKTESCWLWNGCITGNNQYGQIKWKRQHYLAHRLSYMIYVGEIPEGQNVLHVCDNPLCVNPQHLFLGNQRDNMLDAKTKGRNAHGIKNGAAKLCDRDVFEIRAQYNSGVTISSLSRCYCVDRKTIRSIIQRVTWKHI